MDALRPGRSLPAWLAERRALIGDGAMGTALQNAGLPPGACPEIWNLDRPGAVEGVLRAYLEAGAEILETNTFGGTPTKLESYGLAGRCTEINQTAARIGRSVAGDRALVAGSIGPTGMLLAPLGPLGEQEALDAFRRQAEALADGGADALIVETMIDLKEAVLAVRAAAATGLPVIASMTFEETARGPYTVMGAGVAASAAELRSAGASVLGINCGTGPATMVEMVRSLRAETTLPILAQPNAGIPVLKGTEVIYPETPDGMAAYAEPFIGAGASIVGGCCGTTPDHIRALAAAVRRARGAA